MAKRGQLVPEEKMATFFDLVVLDATAVQLHLALDKARTSNDPDLKSYIESTAEVSIFLLILYNTPMNQTSSSRNRKIRRLI